MKNWRGEGCCQLLARYEKLRGGGGGEGVLPAAGLIRNVEGGRRRSSGKGGRERILI